MANSNADLAHRNVDLANGIPETVEGIAEMVLSIPEMVLTAVKKGPQDAVPAKRVHPSSGSSNSRVGGCGSRV
jgi:hypothetical protein